MLILLPPSEGKTRPASGAPLDLDALSFPALTKVRDLLVRTLVKTSATKTAAKTLGLGPSQAGELAINVGLLDEPTARADEVFTGVLFGELDPATLSAEALARAESSVAIASGLFGLVRPGDPIPAYRLAGDVTLPRIGTVTSRWKPLLPRVIADAADGGLVVDLRSGVYVAHGKVPGAATVRVLQEVDGKRSVVSHFNKATKGRIVRALLEDGRDAAAPADFADLLRDLGWKVEIDGDRLDVVVSEAH